MKSGEPCERCGWRLQVVNTRLYFGRLRVRYLGCRKCGYRPPNNRIEANVTIKVPESVLPISCQFRQGFRTV
jgi:hypothetical protein